MHTKEKGAKERRHVKATKTPNRAAVTVQRAISHAVAREIKCQSANGKLKVPRGETFLSYGEFLGI